MAASSKPSRKSKKAKSSRRPKSYQGRPYTPDCSGLRSTTLSNQMSEEQITHILRALVLIGDDHISEINFPYHADSYLGTHPHEAEIMMFFPGVKTNQLIPSHRTLTISGEHFVVGAFPETESPMGETGLMYVCRQFKRLPTEIEAMQFIFDSVDGTWIVSGA